MSDRQIVVSTLTPVEGLITQMDGPEDGIREADPEDYERRVTAFFDDPLLDRQMNSRREMRRYRHKGHERAG